MRTIIILDYTSAEVDIIHNVPDQKPNDYEAYISVTLGYDLDHVHYMVVDGNKQIIPNHFNPEDFQQ